MAQRLLDVALDRFVDDEGALHDTADDAEQLFTRPRATDNAEPSGCRPSPVPAHATPPSPGRPVTGRPPRRALAACGSVAARDPRFAGWSLAVAEAVVAGPLQVAVVGAGEDAAALRRVAGGATSPGLVVALGAPDAPGVPLLAAGRSSAGSRRPTCAVASSATRR